MISRSALFWPMVVTGSAVVAGILTFSNVSSPLRSLIVFWFLAICPGMAIVRVIGVGDPVTELTLAVALSLALDTLVALTMLYAGLWSPEGSLAVLITVSLAGAGVQVVKLHWARRTAVLPRSPTDTGNDHNPEEDGQAPAVT